MRMNTKAMDGGVNYCFVQYNTHLITYLQVCSTWNPLPDCWKNC